MTVHASQVASLTVKLDTSQRELADRDKEVAYLTKVIFNFLGGTHYWHFNS